MQRPPTDDDAAPLTCARCEGESGDGSRELRRTGAARAGGTAAVRRKPGDDSGRTGTGLAETALRRWVGLAEMGRGASGGCAPCASSRGGAAFKGGAGGGFVAGGICIADLGTGAICSGSACRLVAADMRAELGRCVPSCLIVSSTMSGRDCRRTIATARARTVERARLQCTARSPSAKKKSLRRSRQLVLELSRRAACGGRLLHASIDESERVACMSVSDLQY